MNGNSLIIDTNIVLYLLGGDNTLVSLLDDKNIYLSFISELELLSYGGISREEQTVIKRFVKECIVVDITPGIKELCISLRKKHHIKLPDAIIAATSSFLNIPLVSADKTFKKIEEIDIIVYEK